MDAHSLIKRSALKRSAKSPGRQGVLLADHYIEAEGYWTRRPEGMSDWLITYTVSGEGEFRIGGRTFRCRGGDVCLLKADTPHEYGTPAGQIWDVVWAHFIPSLNDLKRVQLPELEPGFVLQTVESSFARKRIYRAFQRIIFDARQMKPFWEELCQGAIEEILLLLAQHASVPLDPRIEKALAYLTERMTEPITVAQVAAFVGLSPSRLAHLFKRQTGEPVLETLNRMRLRQAALLLQHTHSSASEIALDVGFQNYNHFLNQFKGAYGVTPSAFRKSRLRGDGRS